MATIKIPALRLVHERLYGEPGRLLELAGWALLLAVIAWPRLVLWQLVPATLWSKDAMGYCLPAFHWLETGVWDSDPRRGPVYSLFIAALLGWRGAFDAVIIAQHVLGGVAVLIGVAVLRLMHGRRALPVVLACGYAYAVYAGPISMEKLVRNETLLFFFASGTLAAWFLALQRRSGGWLAVAGGCAGLLTLTKNVFVPFPLMALAGVAWLHRRRWRRAAVQCGVFLAAFAVPLVAGKIDRARSPSQRPPEPQSGLLLYARVAQFTVLDGGIEPEIKTLIRDDILAYRDLIADEGDPDNNVVLNRTAVPRMRAHLLARGGTPTDLNRLCRRLAFEAIAAHPREYLAQVAGDLYRLHFEFGARQRGPDRGEVRTSIRVLEQAPAYPWVRAEETLAVLRACTDKTHFLPYVRIVDSAWLFQAAPVFFTTLFLPVLIVLERGQRRWFWLTCGALWLFTLVLLATVGKPLNRYLLPVVPVMFWTLSSVLVFAWRGLERLLALAFASKSAVPQVVVE